MSVLCRMQINPQNRLCVNPSKLSAFLNCCEHRFCSPSTLSLLKVKVIYSTSTLEINIHWCFYKNLFHGLVTVSHRLRSCQFRKQGKWNSWTIPDLTLSGMGKYPNQLWNNYFAKGLILGLYDLPISQQLEIVAPNRPISKNARTLDNFQDFEV